MSSRIATPPGAIIFTGHDNPRTDLLADARRHLLDSGTRPMDADELLVDRPGLVAPAYWGGESVGFVGAEHPGAVAVTAVNLPAPPDVPHAFDPRTFVPEPGPTAVKGKP